jgi:hypothetical protein
MSIVPSRSWWLTPSGGPYRTPWSWWAILSEAPLPAHAIGAWLAVGYVWVTRWLYLHGSFGVLCWWLAVSAAAGWQAWQWERDVYGPPDALVTWREIVWRVLIAAVVALPAAFWL